MSEQAEKLFNDPTQRAEATKTAECRRGWDEPRHPEASEAKASLTPLRAGTEATHGAVRAEARRREDRTGGDPGTAPAAAFDPAADFLLDQAYPNLFEPVHAAIEAGQDRYRCKGCRKVVTPGQREWHWVGHRTASGRTPKAAA